MNITANFRYTGFFDLLVDAVYQHKISVEHDNSYLNNRHSRASISASMLLVECASNCLLNSLDLSKSLFEELDKLPPLAKFDVFLKWSGSEVMDRGRSEVQKVVELIRARNEFAHTKIANIDTEFKSMQQAGELWELPMSLTAKQWIAIGIPKNSMFWSSKDALSVLQAITSFLRYMFKDIMRLDPNDVCRMLSSQVKTDKITIEALYEEFKAELAEAIKFGIDFTFLGIDMNFENSLNNTTCKVGS